MMHYDARELLFFIRTTQTAVAAQRIIVAERTMVSDTLSPVALAAAVATPITR
jgi:hypothetical protein